MNDKVKKVVDQVLPEFDRYKQYSIRYAAGTNRCAISAFNKVAVASPLSLGKLLCEETYKGLAEKYVFDMNFAGMVNAVTNVYGAKFPEEASEFRISEGDVEEVNKRIYPPHYNWLRNRLGMDAHSNDTFSDEIPTSDEMLRVLSPDRETRKQAFYSYVSKKSISDIRDGMQMTDTVGE